MLLAAALAGCGSSAAKNRMIDHAAAALVGSCEQCFQALEAEQPIPGIKEHGRGAGCAVT